MNFIYIPFFLGPFKISHIFEPPTRSYKSSVSALFFVIWFFIRKYLRMLCYGPFHMILFHIFEKKRLSLRGRVH